MSNTAFILKKLVRSLFHPVEPSQLFIDSLYKYTLPSISTIPEIDSYLLEASEKAFSIYKKISASSGNKKDTVLKKLIYVFLTIKNKKPDVLSEIKLYIKQGALGIEVSYFSPSKLLSLKNEIDYASFLLISSIYTHGLYYRQLKLETDNPISNTHRYFLSFIKPVLKEYELAVLDSDYDIFSFYSNMYSSFKKLQKLSQLNDIFRSRSFIFKSICDKYNTLADAANSHLENKDMEVHNYDKNDIGNTDINMLKTSSAAVADDNISRYFNRFQRIPEILKGYESVLYKVFNDCTTSYLLTGSFEDPYNEYFIKGNSIDYGLVPYYIDKSLVEAVCYAGKYTAFLKSINALKIPAHIQDVIRKIDLSKNFTRKHLSLIISNVNSLIRIEFVDKYKIDHLLKYVHSTFLFGRSDFFERLFASLKDARKSTRKSILNLLESCLSSIFPNCEFNQMMDIYISQEEPESFSLYMKINYPISLLIGEEFTIKLVYIFKFLWKLKKIDHLCRRVLNNSKQEIRNGIDPELNHKVELVDEKYKIPFHYSNNMPDQAYSQNYFKDGMPNDQKTNFNINSFESFNRFNTDTVYKLQKYYLLSQNLQFYVFNEVIGNIEIPEFASQTSVLHSQETFIFDFFKKDINLWLDKIIKGVKINTRGKKIEHLLFNMEKTLLGYANKEAFDDSNLVRSIKEFYDAFKNDFATSSLNNLSTYIS